jgi:phage terminase small subunit
MTKPGRKSAADLAAVPVQRERPRIEPPDQITGRAREVFVDLIEAVDPSHFVRSDIPLLVSYAQAIALHEEAREKVAEEGAVVDGRVSPWHVVMEKQAKLISTMAMRLRLSPHSRYDARAAGRKTQKPTGPAPWEYSS